MSPRRCSNRTIAYVGFARASSVGVNNAMVRTRAVPTSTRRRHQGFQRRFRPTSAPLAIALHTIVSFKAPNRNDERDCTANRDLDHTRRIPFR